MQEVLVPNVPARLAATNGSGLWNRRLAQPSVPAVAVVGLADEMIEQALLGGVVGNRTQHLLRLVRQGNSGEVSHYLCRGKVGDRFLHATHHIFRDLGHADLVGDLERGREALCELALGVFLLTVVAFDAQLCGCFVKKPIEGLQNRLFARHRLPPFRLRMRANVTTASFVINPPEI